MRVRIFLIQLTVLFITLPVCEIMAQCGAREVSTANSYYEIGQFDKVIDVLSECLAKDSPFGDKDSKNQKIEALCIMANTYIALDNIDTAKVFIRDLLELDPLFQARTDDPLMFQLLVREVKLGDIGVNVSSVSKVAEKLEYAPATVLLITEEEIVQRGYHDLEALLHDLPGFDISQSNGIFYSNIYQRGYRSVNTDRTLLIIDGVEDNDLWGNFVYLSRQYPISNIESVEVVYGPASTIYGANAFLGVISINTKSPSQLTKDDKNIGVNVQTGYGAWNTRYIDATIAGSFAKDQIGFSFTARQYASDEPDYSNYDWLSFDELDYPNEITLDGLNNVMKITDAATAQVFVDSFGNTSNLFEVFETNGSVDSVKLTDAGAQLAVDKDNQVYDGTNYADRTFTESYSFRLKLYDFTLGWQYWHKKEGTGAWFNDVRQGTSNDGQSWNPTSQFFFIRYAKQINKSISFTSFTRFKVHGLDGDNALASFNGYKTGALTMFDLLNDENSSWRRTYLSVRSNQVRNEAYLTYNPNTKLSFFAGVEARLSSIQTDYITSGDPNPEGDFEGTAAERHLFYTDIGAYMQLTYKMRDDLKVTFGQRFDNSRISNSITYSNFNPRVSLVYYPNAKTVFKAIYATAFKPPTNFDRFSTVAGQRDTINIDLEPEEVTNLEFSVRRVAFNNRLTLDAVGYLAQYQNIIEVAQVTLANGSNTNMFVSTGEQRVIGGHAVATLKYSNIFNNNDYLYVFSNYTYTRPLAIERAENGDIESETRVGDIASHQVNLGVNYRLHGFNASVRMNWVGARKTGEGTTVSTNPYPDLFSPHTVFNGVLGYQIPALGRQADHNIRLDFIVNNIFNTEYFSPGVRNADDTRFSARLPQKPRNLHFRLTYVL